MSLFSTPSQLVAASPVAKKCSIKQPVGTRILQNDPSQFDYRAKERCRSVALFQATWITICRKVIMEFLPNDTKNKLPTPILTGIMHIHMYKRRRLKDQNSCLSLLSWSLFFDLTVRSHTIWTTSKYNHTGLSIQLYDVVRCVSPESSCSCLREWTSWTAPVWQQVPGVHKDCTLGECAVVANSAPRLVTAASTHWDTLSQTRPQHGTCCLRGGVCVCVCVCAGVREREQERDYKSGDILQNLYNKKSMHDQKKRRLLATAFKWQSA